MEKPCNFRITAKTLNVFRNLTVSVALCSKIATSCHFRKIQEIFWKTLFFQNSSNCLSFLRSLTNWVAFYSRLATIKDFWKTQIFFKITNLFWKKLKFWTFWQISLFHWLLTSRWLSSRCFKNWSFFFKTTIYVFPNNPKFERFEKAWFFRRFCSKLAT